MRKSLLDKAKSVESMMNIILLSNAENMRLMNNYITKELSDSEYQAAIPLIANRIDEKLGKKDALSKEIVDIEEALNICYTLGEADRIRMSSKIETEIDITKRSFKNTYNKIKRKKYLKDAEIKYNGWFKSYEWTRLFDDRYYASTDLLYRLMYAMELTQEEAFELAATSRHPIRLIEKREIILYLCLVEKVYDFTDVNDILQRLGENELAGTNE